MRDSEEWGKKRPRQYVQILSDVSWRNRSRTISTLPPGGSYFSQALLPSAWGTLGRFSDFWEHTGEHLETEVLLIPEAVGAALDHADLLDEAFDEPQGHLGLRLAIRRDAVPMRLHQPRELLVRLQTLPAHRRPPLVEEPSCPAGTPVVPELIERLLEQVGLVQASVGLEQQLQRLLPIEAEVFPMGQQGVFVPLDEAAILTRHPGVFGLANLV